MTDNGPDERGEKMNPQWTHQFVDLSEVAAGSFLAPSKMGGEEAREYAALQLVISDLKFAQECFQEAHKIGTPDPHNVLSKALIFSGVVAYARPFMTGVREIRMNEAFFATSGQPFDLQLHKYLMAVRDKHVAHSVNEFERCDTTGLMVGSPDKTKWRFAGIGFTQNIAIGITLAMLEAAISQTTFMLFALATDCDRRRIILYKAGRTKFETEGKWEWAPLARMPSRENAAKRRRD